MSPRSTSIALVVAGLASAAPSASPALWSTQELIGIADTYHDYYPEVAIDPQGVALITWMGVDETGLDYEIYWSRWEEGVGWSTRQRVHPNNTQYDAWPRMSMAPNGTAWVAWLRHRPTGYYWDLLSSHWTSAGWSVPDTVVKGPVISESNYHGMAPVDSTHCWVVYDLSYQVCAREYQGDHWGPVEDVASGMPNDPSQVDAALGPDSQPWAVWSNSSNAGNEATRRFPDGSWGDPFLLNPPGGGGLPAIAVDSEGEAWAIWGDDSAVCPPNDWPDVFFSRTIGGVWQPEAVVNGVETSDCGSDYAPDIATGYGWPPRAVWPRLYPGGASPQYADLFSTSWNSTVWNPLSQVNAPESEVYREDSFPAVAIGPEGEAWAVWKRPTTTQSMDIYGSRLLLDVIDLEAHRGPSGVEVSWRTVGYAPREDFLFGVMRADDSADTTLIGDRVFGQGDEYLVVDETALPQTGYTYWIEVLDPIPWIEPPAGTLLFRTSSVAVEPLWVSVEPGRWRQRAVLRARPNPSSGEVEFEVAGTAGDCLVEVFDVQGRLVWRSGVVHAAGSGLTTVRWSARGPAAGVVYWARLRHPKGGALATSKVILVP